MKLLNWVLKHALMADALYRASGYYIKDGFENNRDRTPVLGRGYSPQTNILMGTCVEAHTDKDPSFDYEYNFVSIKSAAGPADDGTGPFAREWGRVTSKLSVTAKKALDEMVVDDMGVSLATTYQKYMLASMSGHIYYNILDEGSSPLTDDAFLLLQRGGYIGFIQACGPYYIKSIQRTKEIITVFNFEKATGTATVTEMRNSLGQAMETDLMGTVSSPLFNPVDTTLTKELRSIEFSPTGNMVFGKAKNGKLWVKDGGMTAPWTNSLSDTDSWKDLGGWGVAADDEGTYVYAIKSPYQLYRKGISECATCWTRLSGGAGQPWYNMMNVAVSGNGKHFYSTRPDYDNKYYIYHTQSGRPTTKRGFLNSYAMNYDATSTFALDPAGQLYHAEGSNHPDVTFKRIDDPGWGSMLTGWPLDSNGRWPWRNYVKILSGWQSDSICQEACSKIPGATACMYGDQWWSDYWRGCFVFLHVSIPRASGYWHVWSGRRGGYKTWVMKPPRKKYLSVTMNNDGSKVLLLDDKNKIWKRKRTGGMEPFEMIGIPANKQLSQLSQSADGKWVAVTGPGGSYYLNYPTITKVTTTKVDTETMTITILGYGLSMMQENSGSLVAKTFEEYEAAMAFGFESMKNTKTGVVKGVEVHPWTANVSFYANAKLDVVVEKEECYSLTTRMCAGKKCKLGSAYTDCTATCYYLTTAGEHEAFDCRDGRCSFADDPNECLDSDGNAENEAFTYEVDDTPTACVNDEYKNYAIFDNSFRETDITTTVKDNCDDDATTYNRLVIEFPPNLKSIIFAENAEFIATTDSIVRQMFTLLELLSQCAGMLNAMPDDSLKLYWVLNQRMPIALNTYDTVNIDDHNSPGRYFIGPTYRSPLSANGLKAALNGYDSSQTDEFKQYLYGREVNKFLDYINGYYEPCLTSLSGDDLDFSGGAIFTTHWVQQPNCAKPLCLLKGTYWDTDNCVFETNIMNLNYDPIPADNNQDDVIDLQYALDSFCMPQLYKAVTGTLPEFDDGQGTGRRLVDISDEAYGIMEADSTMEFGEGKVDLEKKNLRSRVGEVKEEGEDVYSWLDAVEDMP